MSDIPGDCLLGLNQVCLGSSGAFFRGTRILAVTWANECWGAEGQSFVLDRACLSSILNRHVCSKPAWAYAHLAGILNAGRGTVHRICRG